MSLQEGFPERVSDSTPDPDAQKQRQNVHILMSLCLYRFQILTPEALVNLINDVRHARQRYGSDPGGGFMVQYFPEPDHFDPSRTETWSFGVHYYTNFENGIVQKIANFVPLPRYSEAAGQVHYDGGAIIPIFPEDIDQDELAYRMSRQDT